MLHEVQRTIRVLVVDAHPVVRSGLQLSLSRRAGITVLSSVSSVQEALIDEASPAPDVAIIDIDPVSSAAKRLWGRFPCCRIIAFPSVDSEKSLRDALRAGVHGYLSKSASLEEVVRAVRTVHKGELYFRGREQPVESSPPRNGHARRPCPPLTRRERQVLGLIAEGHTSRRIATLLRVSIRTVESHREHIVRKLGIRTVAGLTRFAIENDLVEPSNG